MGQVHPLCRMCDCPFTLNRALMCRQEANSALISTTNAEDAEGTSSRSIINRIRTNRTQRFTLARSRPSSLTRIQRRLCLWCLHELDTRNACFCPIRVCDTSLCFFIVLTCYAGDAETRLGNLLTVLEDGLQRVREGRRSCGEHMPSADPSTASKTGDPRFRIERFFVELVRSSSVKVRESIHSFLA